MDSKATIEPEPGSAAAKGKATRRVRGIDRVVHILNHLHQLGRPVRINEMAKGINAPRSTVYEIVDRLVKERILEVFDEEGRVFLGRKLYYYGLSYIEKFDLTHEAGKHLKVLTEKTGETSQLCMVEGNKYAVVMMRHGARHFKISSDVGETIPLPWTASGRLLLSSRTAAEILALVPPEDFVLPDGTRLSPDRFLDEIRLAGPAGFCSCDTIVDSYTHCFAASVINELRECIATLCLVVPRVEAHRRYESLKSALIGEAQSLSSTLGGRGIVDVKLDVA